MSESTSANAEASQTLLSAANLTRVRLVSGFILFGYVLVHFLNHALGLISIETMGMAASYIKAFWRTWPATIVLYGALVAHMGLALWKLYERRTLAMARQDWVQLITGLAIPPLMVVHVMGTRWASAEYGINDTYAYVVLVTFVIAPFYGVLNTIGLLAAWIHSCVGLHMWLRLKKSYTLFHRNVGLVLSALIPAFSLAGYLAAGRQVSVLSASGEWMQKYYERLRIPDDAVWGWITRDTDMVKYGLLALLVFVLLARWVRNMIANHEKLVTIEYLDGPTVKQPVGSSLLEISAAHDVPHASVCGGRGRCSTCRVQLLNSKAPFAKAPSENERRVLDRVGAGSDMRLACQLVPTGDMKVMRVLPSDSTLSGAAHEPWATGQERTVVVLFADLRDFTRTSESRLPFDVVYLINQFSQAMGRSVENHGGRIDKFLGDGLMAIFGIDIEPEEAANNALEAASEMRERLAVLNGQLANDLSEPLRMGIGLHIGPVVLGNMGYGASRGLTAIGDTVNTASRLESETKGQGCEICVSSALAKSARVNFDKAHKRRIEVRGKREKLDIYALDGQTLDESLLMANQSGGVQGSKRQAMENMNAS